MFSIRRAFLFIFIETTFLCLHKINSFTPFVLPVQQKRCAPRLFFVDEKNSKSPMCIQRVKIRKSKSSIVEKIDSLDDLKYLLEEDDRLVAIKISAPWCKTCQKLGKNFDRFALEMADGIVNRQLVKGRIRCAQVEVSSETKSFITEQLQVIGVPTLQLYRGTYKIWEGSGKSNTKELREILSNLEKMRPEKLQAHAEAEDDGILLAAIEDSMFSYPSFLEEEW